jgi:hypothetical protein
METRLSAGGHDHLLGCQDRCKYFKILSKLTKNTSKSLSLRRVGGGGGAQRI